MRIVIILIYVLLMIANYVLFVNKKRLVIVELLTMFLLILLMGGNTDCADYIDYQNWYESQTYPIVMEPGYMAVANLFSTLGLSFVGFRFVYYSFFFILLIVALSRIINNYHLLCLCYLGLFFILDTIQIRNTMAIAFLLLAIAYLAKGQKLRFIIIVVMATLFHYSFAIFLSVLFYKKIIWLMKNHARSVYFISILLCVVAAVGYSFNILNTIIASAWGESKVQYLSARLLNLFFVLMPISTYLVTKQSRNMIRYSEQNELVKSYADIVYSIGILFILLLPIIVLSHEFVRMVRDASIEVVALASVVFIYGSDFFVSNTDNVVWRRYKLIFISFIIIWMTFQYWQGYPEIFNNNIIFGEL